LLGAPKVQKQLLELSRSIMHAQKKNREKRFNEVQQFAYVFGTEGREILLIKSPTQVTNKDTIPLNI